MKMKFKHGFIGTWWKPSFSILRLSLVLFGSTLMTLILSNCCHYWNSSSRHYSERCCQGRRRKAVFLEILWSSKRWDLMQHKGREACVRNREWREGKSEGTVVQHYMWLSYRLSGLMQVETSESKLEEKIRFRNRVGTACFSDKPKG